MSKTELPPWESAGPPVWPSVPLPGLDMALIPARTGRDRREWCEAWLADWLEAGGVRCRVGKESAEWDRWWQALQRRGLGRTQGLYARVSEVAPAGGARKGRRGAATATNMLPRAIELWAGGPWVQNATPWPVADDWQSWWQRELGIDLRMLCCLWEVAMISRPARVSFQALFTELRIVQKIDRRTV